MQIYKKIRIYANNKQKITRALTFVGSGRVRRVDE